MNKPITDINISMVIFATTTIYHSSFYTTRLIHQPA